MPKFTISSKEYFLHFLFRSFLFIANLLILLTSVGILFFHMLDKINYPVGISVLVVVPLILENIKFQNHKKAYIKGVMLKIQI